MPDFAPIDTDVLIKVAAWQLGMPFIDVVNSFAIPATLELTHLIAGKQIAGIKSLSNPRLAEKELQSVLSRIESLEPNDEEIALASEFEDHANLSGLPFDRGESQLLAIVFNRSHSALISGDKRATSSISQLLSELGKPELFRSCVVCMEQIMLKIIESMGIDEVQKLVCSESQIDKAVVLCLRCGRSSNTGETTECFNSYIRDLDAKSNQALLHF